MEPTATRRVRTVVVTPTYDEKDTIADLIAAVLAEQPGLPDFELHVLVADSHSEDGTREIVQRLADANPRVHLLDVRQRGIGVGLYQGFRHAIDALDAEVLIEMDADFQHSPADLPVFLGKIVEGFDLVSGSRFVPGSQVVMSWPRRILSVTSNRLMRMLLGLEGVSDFTTSYRAFTRDLFLKVDPDSVAWQERSFIFVPVFLCRLIEAGARFTEVPIAEIVRQEGYSKIDYWRYMRDIARFAVKARMGRLRR